MKSKKINHTTWQTLANDKKAWRGAIKINNNAVIVEADWQPRKERNEDNKEHRQKVQITNFNFFEVSKWCLQYLHYNRLLDAFPELTKFGSKFSSMRFLQSCRLWGGGKDKTLSFKYPHEKEIAWYLIWKAIHAVYLLD